MNAERVHKAVAAFARERLGCLLLLALLVASSALATGPSWPIEPRVTFPAKLAPEGGTAHVDVAVFDDATNIRIDVFGSDGMTVEPDNKLSVTVASLKRGDHFAFDVTARPGSGKSALVVQTKARFAHTSEGGSVREFQFGAENAAQVAEHSRCVRQDADGTWIRVMGCDDEPKATRVEGYVVDSYLCPPCPKGAQCKPCIRSSAIFVAGSKNHAPVSVQSPAADITVIETGDPARFDRETRYRFEISGGRLERSQPADEKPWQ